jgi:7-keto-8-aminopelargonate synthetase-like enzyme
MVGSCELQIQDLLEWLLQRGRELNATSQLGPQGLGATAGAVSRLQQAQRQQQQQQRQLAAQQQAVLRQQQEAEAAAEAAARRLRQQQAAEVERDQLMRELVDAAVSQKHRLSPQVS